MTGKTFEPGSPEFLQENRRRSLAGELPQEVPMAYYQVQTPSFIDGVMRGGGDVVHLAKHTVLPTDKHLIEVTLKDPGLKPAPAVEPYVEPLPPAEPPPPVAVTTVKKPEEKPVATKPAPFLPPKSGV